MAADNDLRDAWNAAKKVMSNGKPERLSSRDNALEATHRDSARDALTGVVEAAYTTLTKVI
jgi:hypothetical protein